MQTGFSRGTRSATVAHGTTSQGSDHVERHTSRPADRCGHACARIRTSSTRGHSALPTRRGALPGLRGSTRWRGTGAAAVRGAGVRGLPRLRAARARVPPRRLRRLPGRTPGRLQLQATRLLSELRRQAHGRDCGPARRRGLPRAARATVGAERAAPAPVPVRERPRDHERGARRRPSLPGLAPDRQGRSLEKERPHRRRDADPALRRGAEPERALPHAPPRRCLRRACRRHAALSPRRGAYERRARRADPHPRPPDRAGCSSAAASSNATPRTPGSPATRAPSPPRSTRCAPPRSPIASRSARAAVKRRSRSGRCRRRPRSRSTTRLGAERAGSRCTPASAPAPPSAGSSSGCAATSAAPPCPRSACR